MKRMLARQGQDTSEFTIQSFVNPAKAALLRQSKTTIVKDEFEPVLPRHGHIALTMR